MKRYIRSSDDNDSWFDPYQGHTYYIAGDDDNHVYLSDVTNDPKKAIESWFKIGNIHESETSIMTKTRSDAIKLCEAGTEDLLRSLDKKYGCPYNIDYMINACKRQVEDGCKYFHENEYGDQVHPFDVG